MELTPTPKPADKEYELDPEAVASNFNKKVYNFIQKEIRKIKVPMMCTVGIHTLARVDDGENDEDIAVASTGTSFGAMNYGQALFSIKALFCGTLHNCLIRNAFKACEKIMKESDRFMATFDMADSVLREIDSRTKDKEEE